MRVRACVRFVLHSHTGRRRERGVINRPAGEGGLAGRLDSRGRRRALPPRARQPAGRAGRARARLMARRRVAACAAAAAALALAAAPRRAAAQEGACEDLMSWCDITVGTDAESCLTQAIEYNCRATCHAAWPDAGYCSGRPSSGPPPGTQSSPPPPSPPPPPLLCFIIVTATT